VPHFITPAQGAHKSSTLSKLISFQETSLHFIISIAKSNSYFWQATTFIFSEEVVWDDEDREGPQNIGLFTMQPSDMANSQRIFYWRWVRPSPLVLQHQVGKMYQSLQKDEFGMLVVC